MNYPTLEGRGRQYLPEFLSKKQTIINIQNNDERCFGYALLYILERANLLEKHCVRPTHYKEEMFERHHINNLPYRILPNDVHLYKAHLQMNINVFAFFDG